MVTELSVAVPKLVKVTEGVVVAVEIVPVGAAMAEIPASLVGVVPPQEALKQLTNVIAVRMRAPGNGPKPFA